MYLEKGVRKCVGEGRRCEGEGRRCEGEGRRCEGEGRCEEKGECEGQGSEKNTNTPKTLKHALMANASSSKHTCRCEVARSKKT